MSRSRGCLIVIIMFIRIIMMIIVILAVNIDLYTGGHYTVAVQRMVSSILYSFR